MDLNSLFEADPEALYTPVEQIEGHVRSLRGESDGHGSAGSKRARTTLGVPTEKRKEMIQALLDFLVDPSKREWFAEAEFRDLRRPKRFSNAVMMGCIASCKVALEKMDSWCADKRNIPDVPAPNPGSRASRQYVRYEPKGVALIIGTWNFPLPLLLKPLISAIAAGCPCVCKLSEVSVCTSLVLKKVIEEVMDPQGQYIKCVFGAVPHSTALLDLCGKGIDVVFYTGNTTVGRIVYQKAAAGLTPCILELGGKNPVLVTKSCDLKTTVRKLVDAKFQNVGQFCVSPDHVILQQGVDVTLFRSEVEAAMLEYYGEDAKASGDYSRIVNSRHWDRLHSLLQHELGLASAGTSSGTSSASSGASGASGTSSTSSTSSTPHCSAADRSDLFIPPVVKPRKSQTVFWDPPAHSRLLKEEVFGPLLPILTPDSSIAARFNGFETLQDMIECANCGCMPDGAGAPSAPLALYLCCGNGDGKDPAESEEALVVATTRSGGVCVNDFMVHMLNETLPFGGLGHSGFGNYHGEWGVRAFQHERAVMVFGADEFTRARYPNAPSGL